MGYGWTIEDAMTKIQEFSETNLALEEAFKAYAEVEERNVLVAALGEEKYRRQQQDKADLDAAMMEVQIALTSPDPNVRTKFLKDAQQRAQIVFQSKLQGARSTSEMDEILGSLSADERMAVFRMQAISQTLGMGGGGGHSHNGQPCHGHGHHAPPPAHTHSHNGQPCGGHGHSHGGAEELEEGEYEDDDEEEEYEDDHGHSHDHHGHSHDDHGHSHDHHGHSHDHHHGHSH
jgi:hypothetical protein